MAWPLCQGSGGHVLQLCSPSGPLGAGAGKWHLQAGCCRHQPAPVHSVGQSSWPGSETQGRGQHGSQPALGLSQPVPRVPTSTFSGRAEVRDIGTGAEGRAGPRVLLLQLGFCPRAWGHRVPRTRFHRWSWDSDVDTAPQLVLARMAPARLPLSSFYPRPSCATGAVSGLPTFPRGGGGGREKPEGGDGAKGMAFKPLPPPQRVTPTVTLSMASSWTLALPTRPCSSISGRQTRRTTPASWASIAPVMCAVSARHPLARVQTPWPSAAVGTFILEGEPRQ